MMANHIDPTPTDIRQSRRRRLGKSMQDHSRKKCLSDGKDFKPSLTFELQDPFGPSLELRDTCLF